MAEVSRSEKGARLVTQEAMRTSVFDFAYKGKCLWCIFSNLGHESSIWDFLGQLWTPLSLFFFF